MPTWGQILYEHDKLVQTQAQQKNQQVPGPSPLDMIRTKYLGELAAYTGRPLIVYASGWMEGRAIPDPSLVSVTNRDISGFMECVHGLERGSLDLILHSPGGDANAAEAIMDYLRKVGFDPIRAIIPLSAMSAATMMALACDEILMGHHSQVGPIDPQFTLATPEGPRGAPAQAILDQFDLAKTECGTNPSALAAWLPILRSYGPGLLSQCVNAQTAAQNMVSASLQAHMLKDEPDADRARKADEIAAWFNNHNEHLSHGRSLRYADIKTKGVKAHLLEEDEGQLQDKVLSAWHSVSLTLSRVPVHKLIQNSANKTFLTQAAQMQLVMEPVPGVPTRPAPQPAQPQGPNRAARRQGR